MAAARKLILVGGGGHCRSCIDVIEALDGWMIGGILDVSDRVGGRVFDYAIVGTDDDIGKFAEGGAAFLVTLGQIESADRRAALYDKIRAVDGLLPTVVSPHAYVSARAKLGQGTIVMHHAVVNSGAVVGDNVIVNSMALIEHDALVGDHCHISTAAVVNGGASVGPRTFVGSNAVLHHGAKVPEGAVVAAGAIFRA